MIWLKRGAVGLAGLLLLAFAIVYGGSEMLFRRQVPLDLPDIHAATAPADIAEGARLAAIVGCRVCHGDAGQGRLMIDNIAIGRIMAPSLAQVAAEASDGQLARAIRNGVSVHARPLFVMPSEAFNRLSDQDLSRLIGWIRSLPFTGNDLVGGKQVGPLGRLGVLTGRFPSSVTPQGGQPATRPHDLGRYFAQTSCESCHALDHDRAAGSDGEIAPALAPMVAAYDRAALHRLLRTGQAAGGRQLKMMSDDSQRGLKALTDQEIDAIQAYLRDVIDR